MSDHTFSLGNLFEDIPPAPRRVRAGVAPSVSTQIAEQAKQHAARIREAMPRPVTAAELNEDERRKFHDTLFTPATRRWEPMGRTINTVSTPGYTLSVPPTTYEPTLTLKMHLDSLGNLFEETSDV